MEITLEEALKRASFRLREAGISNPRAEAELLLASVLGLDRLQLYTKMAGTLPEAGLKNYEATLKRRVNHEPLAYITNEKHFYGRPFIIGRDVLIPRPETELLLDLALGWARNSNLLKSGLRILDIGTGSGVLAITLALELPSAEVWAVDVSPGALKIAGRNASIYKLGGRVKFLQGSYFEPLKSIFPVPRFQLIVSNPPYISTSEMAGLPASVVDYEPGEALYGGEDGCVSYRAILESISLHAEPPAMLVVEIGSALEQMVNTLFKESRLFRMIGCRRDLADHPRAVFGLL